MTWSLDVSYKVTTIVVFMTTRLCSTGRSVPQFLTFCMFTIAMIQNVNSAAKVIFLINTKSILLSLINNVLQILILTSSFLRLMFKCYEACTKTEKGNNGKFNKRWRTKSQLARSSAISERVVFLKELFSLFDKVS